MAIWHCNIWLQHMNLQWYVMMYLYGWDHSGKAPYMCQDAGICSLIHFLERKSGVEEKCESLGISLLKWPTTRINSLHLSGSHVIALPLFWLICFHWGKFIRSKNVLPEDCEKDTFESLLLNGKLWLEILIEWAMFEDNTFLGNSQHCNELYYLIWWIIDYSY